MFVGSKAESLPKAKRIHDQIHLAFEGLETFRIWKSNRVRTRLNANSIWVYLSSRD